MTPTFKELEVAYYKLETCSPLWYKIMHALGSADENANETVYVEKAASASDLESLKLASLEGILCYCDDPETRDWFAAQGFKW